MYNSPISIPIYLGTCGAISGLVGGGCTQFIPVWVGATTGASIGCIVCMYVAAMPEYVTIQRSIEPRYISDLSSSPSSPSSPSSQSNAIENAQQSKNAEIYGESKDVNVSI